MEETGNSEKRMDFEILGCLGFKPNGVGHIKRRNSAKHSHTGGNQFRNLAHTRANIRGQEL